MKRRFTLLAIAAFMSTTVIAQPTQKDGKYQIATKADLVWLAEQVNGGNDFSGEYFEQIADIDLGGIQNADGTWKGTQWIPIGNNSNQFSGTYDGAGNVINNIFYSDSSTQYVGLFGGINNATLTRITVASGYLYGYQCVGGICGYSKGNSRIELCANNATIFGKMECNGGILGFVDKTTGTTTISDCINYGLISAFNFSAGIFGYNEKAPQSPKIYNCVNVGQVFGMRISCGNIIGYNEGGIKYDGNEPYVSNCYYDNQINVIGAMSSDKTKKENDADVAGIIEGKATSELIGEKLKSVLGDTYWHYETGMYPRLECNHSNEAIIVAATPILLNSNDKADNVTKDFTVTIKNDVSWTGDHNVTISGQSATILKSTGAAISCSKDGYTKKVYLKTNKPGATQIGSGNAPLTIESEKELKELRKAVKYYGSYKNCAAYDGFKGVHFKVTVDIDLSDWTEPIGVHNSFKGIFDGNHRTISGINTNQPDIAIIGGLFGCASYGEIKNITVSSNEGQKVSGIQFVGGICGSTFLETLTNCISYCTVKATEVSVKSYYGGIVGVDKGYSSFIGCENHGNITGKQYIGGIMGASNMGSTFDNCSNYGTINNSSSNTAGICANPSKGCSFSNCQNHGEIISTSDNSGGIVGLQAKPSTISINNCINTGSISGVNNVGGILGQDAAETCDCTIDNCLNMGIITGTDKVGGINGGSQGKTTISNCFNSGSFNGNGISGKLSATSSCSYCINIGNVSGTAIGSATIFKCFSDTQMCTAATHDDEKKTTVEMTGTALNTLGSNWTYSDGMYPMIKSLSTTDYMKVAATALILDAADNIDEVKNNFTYNTENGVEWTTNNPNVVSFIDGTGYIAFASTAQNVVDTVKKGKIVKIISMGIEAKDGMLDPEISWPLSEEGNAIKHEYGYTVSDAEIHTATAVAVPAFGDLKYSVNEPDLLNVGIHTITATFIPKSGVTNYASKSEKATLIISPKTLTEADIDWNPKNITYGDENSDSDIKNASLKINDINGEPIEGEFYYTIPPLKVGPRVISLIFEGTNYKTATPIVKQIIVSAAKPAIAWAEPAAIDYGTPLSALQLGAVSGVEGEFTYSAKNNETGVENTVESGTILNAGTYTLKAVFDAESENYADGESMTVQLVVNKLKPEITWEPETAFAELNYGETLDEDAFYASVDDEFDNFGSLSYFENNEAIDIWSVLPAGTHTITAKFEPSNDNYDNNTAVATIKINKATPVITWLSTDEERTVKYGTALSATQLNASVKPADAGTVRFAFDAAGTIDAMGASDRDAGTCAVYAIIDESDNYNSAQISKDIVIGKADLVINWDPQGFTYGATSEEIASAVETAEVSFNEQALTDGTFIYTYPSPLNAGDNQDVSVKFVPNSTNFNNAEDTKPINIAKATPEIVWEPQNVTYGASSEEIAEALKNAEAKFKGVSVNGDYNYTLPLTTDLQVGLEEGELIAAVIFTPTGDDAVNFEEASAIVNVVVDKADPTITWEPTVTEYTFGTELSVDQLNATTNGEGEIVYTDGETEIAVGDILDAGPHTITATLAESDNYNEATENITITVNPAESEITWETPATIAYGTPISAVELNATANTEGTFTYTLDGNDAEGLTPNVGSYTITANFTPASTNYKEATATVTLKVASAAAEITWATPEAITYGTAIGAAQLNATANTEGEFVYSVREGDVLPAGADSLFVKFIPDSPDFGRALDTVILTVNKAELTVSVADTTVNIGDAMPEFKLVYTGFVNNENESNLSTAPTATCAATTAEAGVFDIVVSGGESDNYNITCTNGKLIVVEATTPETPVITWAEPAAITYGTLISADILNATANVEGSFTYSVNVGDTLKAGTHELIATFVPVNNTLTQNVPFITDTVKLTVNKATLTVSVADATVNQGDDMPSFTFSYEGFVLDENMSVLTAIPSAKCNATTDKAGTFDIVVSGGEAENYSFEYKNGKLTVNAKENISAIADNEVKISVYPNPTADVFFVETEAEVELIYVYNMTGKLVLTEANVGKTRIDLANEPQGTYFVKVGDKTIKVLKF